jgi:hypothetical protein
MEVMRAAALVLLLAPGCAAAEVGLIAGGTIDHRGRLSVEIMPRAGVGVGGDDSSGLMLLQVAGDFAWDGRSWLCGAGPVFGAFWKDGPEGIGKDLAFGAIFASDGGLFAVKAQAIVGLYDERGRSTTELQDCSDEKFTMEACTRHWMGNLGGALTLGVVFHGEGDLAPRLQVGAGVLASATMAEE